MYSAGPLAAGVSRQGPNPGKTKTGLAAAISNRHADLGRAGLGLAKITLQLDLAGQGRPLISHTLEGPL